MHCRQPGPPPPPHRNRPCWSKEAVAIGRGRFGPAFLLISVTGSARKVSPLLGGPCPCGALCGAWNPAPSHLTQPAGALCQAAIPGQPAVLVSSAVIQPVAGPCGPDPLLKSQAPDRFLTPAAFPGQTSSPPGARGRCGPRFARLLGPDGGLLIGIDQPRAWPAWRAAYNGPSRLISPAFLPAPAWLRLKTDLGGSSDPRGPSS